MTINKVKNKCLRNIFCFIICNLMGAAAVAQGLQADFTVSVTSGCAPLEVKFTNTSTGNPTTFEWYVGNNSTPFDIENPSTTYIDGGTFSVTLTISDGTNTSTITKSSLITVYPKPLVDFSITPAKGCVPLSVTFNDLTQNSQLVNWTWGFGNGAQNMDMPNPTVVYSAVGEYNVFLIGKDRNGCQGNKSVNKAVKVTPQPKAGFTTDKTGSCFPPVKVSFVPEETDPNLTYTWTIEGLGTFTTRELTDIEFNTSGKFDVTLEVSGPGGCYARTDSPDMIKIENPVADFSIPPVGCKNRSVAFANNSTGASTYSWDFGDGTPLGTGTTPNHTYASTGTFTVTLTVTASNGCQDVTSRQIKIENPVANFLPLNAYACEVPATIIFNSTSTDAATHSWTPGGTQPNGTTTAITFNSEGTFPVTLNITSPGGCPANKTTNVKIKKPVARFIHTDTLGGCYPMDVKFQDKSVSDSGIVKWTWRFGDGSTSSQRNPSHTYTSDSNFVVYLEIENSLGCKAIDSAILRVGEQPVPLFHFDQLNWCAKDGMNPILRLFDDSYPISDLTKTDPQKEVDYWKWTISKFTNFANDSLKGPIETIRNDQNPELYHTQQTEWMDIELIVGIKGCLDTIEKLHSYYVFGPIIRQLNAEVSCGDKTINLLSDIVDFHHLEIDFGDHTKDTIMFYHQDTILTPVTKPITLDTLGYDTISLTKFPGNRFVNTYDNVQRLVAQHTFPGPGVYRVILKAMLDTLKYSPFAFRADTMFKDTMIMCEYSDTLMITISDFGAEISGLDTVCKNSKPQYNAVNSGNAVSFEWFVNGVKQASGMVYNNTNALTAVSGRHKLQLVVKDDLGCADTATMFVSVLEPKPVITLESGTTTGCAPLVLNFAGSDTSGVPVVRWLWTYVNSSLPQDSVQNPDTIAFNASGEYTIRLTAFDKFGCFGLANYSTTIKVGTTSPAFSIDKEIACQGDSIKFTNTSTATPGVAYTWAFSSGETLFTKDAAIAPDTFGVFTATLKLDIGGGCKSEITKNYTVEPKPMIDFKTDSSLVSNCYPYANVNFVAMVTPQIPGYQYTWDLGEGSPAYSEVVYTSYLLPGVYDIKLTVSSPSGACTDSLIKIGYITVRGPVAEMEISDDTVCVKDLVTFRIKNKQNVEKFRWDFNDGTIQQGTGDFTLHAYNQVGVVRPLLIIKAGDCEVPIEGQIFVNDVIAKFDLPREPSTFKIGIDTLRGCGTYDLEAVFNGGQGSIDIFKWQLEEGGPLNSDTTQLYTYPVGIYKLMLEVSDLASGCSDIIYQVIEVSPPVTADAGRDYALCPGDAPIQLVGGPEVVGGYYQWSPSVGLGTPNNRVTDANPATTQQYVLTVTDSNGCQDTDVMEIFRDRTFVGFTIADKEECGQLVLDVTNTSVARTYLWSYDINSSTLPIPSHTFTSPGKYYVTLTAYDSLPRCGYTVTDSVEVFPIPEITTVKDSMICLGNSLFLLGNTDASPVVSSSWSPVTALSDPSILNPLASPSEKITYVLTVNNTHCQNQDSVTIDIDSADAGFSLSQTSFCQGTPITITNTSAGGQYYNWKFSDNPAHVSTDFEPSFIYTFAGTHTVRLIVRDSLVVCQDTAFQSVIVYPPPPLVVGPGSFICNYQSHQLTASGGVAYDWTPGYELSDSTIANPVATPDTTTLYTVVATDAVGCISRDSILVQVQPDYSYNQPPASDTIVIGQTVNLDVSSASSNISYTWTPDVYISCNNCPDPTFQPLETTCYNLALTDDKNCYPKSASYCIIVLEKYTVDVPTAFSPNQDGRNDKIFVRGFGIRKLLNFTIYNRWGEVVFETTDMNVGWDGIYKDKVQNDETYVFVVNAEMYSGEVITRNGYISLLK